MTISPTPTRQIRKHGVVLTLLLSVTFGFVAGAVGMMVAAAYALPSPVFQGSSLSVLRGRTSGSAQEEAAPSADPARAAVLFMPPAPRDLLAPVRSYVPAEAFGAGIVLTSDGWLIADEASFPKGRTPQDSVAVVGAKSYPIRESVGDPFTGIVFLKIDGSNLPVTSFGQGSDLTPGGLAYAFDPEGGLRRLGVTAYDDAVAASASDLVRGSERLQKVIRLSGADDLLPGAMVLNKKGGVSGILAGRDASGAYAVPFEDFSGIIGGVLREKKPGRPYLGVRYVDLSRLLAPDAAHAAGRGAMLVESADGSRPAVIRKSPAELAGLVAGDVIVAVGGEQVSVKSALPELLAQYQPGSAVTLAVQGPKGERIVEATLAATPAAADALRRD